MSLSESQTEALNHYLSSNRETCPKCGSDDWEFGDIELPAAEVTLGNEEIKPSGQFVEITCRSRGETQAIDCIEAGIPEV